MSAAYRDLFMVLGAGLVFIAVTGFVLWAITNTVWPGKHEDVDAFVARKRAEERDYPPAVEDEDMERYV